MEAEATAHIGAEHGEHTATRTTMRNGHRERTLTTQAGDLDLGIPKVRTGAFFPSLPRLSSAQSFPQVDDLRYLQAH
ncbi:transposase [Streptomyces sp. NPDC020799]|uniref:transposase n=1 Tax=Streptomyces sp. NPDC020799 TaxID=3365091 RepID=UPI0037ADB92E